MVTMPPGHPHHQRYVSCWFEEATTSHCQFWLVYRFFDHIIIIRFCHSIILFTIYSVLIGIQWLEHPKLVPLHRQLLHGRASGTLIGPSSQSLLQIQL